ncbi:MAG: DUF3089 domain-containing protein [Polyangiaceae bacterium]
MIDAFAHYLGQHNHGRPVVVVGHSQGAYMAVQVLRRFFDGDPELAPRLLAGLVIGGRVEVPPGDLVGVTFRSLPLCTGADEIGCVVALRSYREGADVTGDMHGPPKGIETGCVVPAETGADGRASVSGFYFSAAGHPSLEDVPGLSTPFVLLRDMYSMRCVPGAGGFTHLAISETRAPGDARPVPFDMMAPRFEQTQLGLHVVEMQLLQGDLVSLIRRKAAVATAKCGGRCGAE